MYFRLLSDESHAEKDKLYCLGVPQHGLQSPLENPPEFAALLRNTEIENTETEIAKNSAFFLVFFKYFC